MSEWLKKMNEAFESVHEAKKMDPVNKKALKKDFDDREDKDIDNDGDVDSSDKYLHNRRKTISKATKGKETETQVDESIGDTFKKARTKLFGPSKKEKEAANRKAAMKKVHSGSHDQHLNSAIDGARDPKHTGHQGMNSYHSQMAREHEGTPAAKHHQSAANSHAEAQHHLEKYKKSGDANSLKRAVYHSGNAVKHAQAAVKAGGDKADTHHVHVSTQNAMYYHKKMNESAAIQPATHKGYQDPMDKGLSPSAKDELKRTTDAPSDAFDANKVIAKTFKDMRASLKNKKMRPGDQATGDKAPVKNDGK